MQRTVSNLFAGIVLLLDKSIKPGDILEVGGTFGWVASLGARYVEVETRDGTQFLIPNEDIITHQVFNWTHQNDNVRLKIRVRVAYDADVRQALALMREAAGRPARVLKTPAPNPLVIGFGENGLELELRFWIADVRNGIHNVSSDVFLEILDLFREHGIKIPLPQRDRPRAKSAAAGGEAPLLRLREGVPTNCHNDSCGMTKARLRKVGRGPNERPSFHSPKADTRVLCGALWLSRSTKVEYQLGLYHASPVPRSRRLGGCPVESCV